MNINLIPGIQQDYKGMNFQIGIDEKGNQHIIPYIEENPVHTRGLEKVIVESKSLLPQEHMNELTIRKLESGHLFKAGDSFESFLCLQGQI